MAQAAERQELQASGDAAPRSYPVLIWALIGVVWAAVALRALYGWVTSERDFGPVEMIPGDEMSLFSMIALRVIEVVSVLVLLAAIWYLAVKPWRESREIRMEGLLIVGGIFGFVMDSWLNLYSFLFAFNGHSVNLGAWSAHLPFHQEGVPTEYGEALLWGLPMYVYFCSALAAMGLALRSKVRRRFPAVSETSLLAIMFAFFFVFDFVAENLIIRTSEAYSFVQTKESLTLWAGEQHQFPIYETFLVACVAMGFAAVRLSAERDPDRLSFIERGVQHLPRRCYQPARMLAAIGYAAVVLMLCYHLPFNWISVGGDSFADLPSYLTPLF